MQSKTKSSSISQTSNSGIEMFKSIVDYIRKDIGAYISGALATVLMLSRLNEGGLRVDNILYASISRNILTSDNPLLMTFAGEAYNNKPPLFFWLNSLFVWMFGNNTFGAKLTTVGSTIILTVLVYKLAKKIYESENAGYISAILFISNYLVFKNSIACRMESLLTLLTLVSIYAAYLYVEKSENRYILLSGFFSGLAVMTKGPAGALSFVMILGVLIITKKINKNSILIIIASFVLFIATFSWWYIYAYLHSDFIQVFIGRESLGRISTADSDFNVDPLHSYLVTILKYCQIHFLLFFLSVAVNLKQIKRDYFFLLSMSFAVVYLIVIHFLSTKYSRYLYIIIPYISIYGSGFIIRYTSFEIKRYIQAIIVLLLLFFAIYPGDFGKPSYKGIITAREISESGHIKITASEIFADLWESRAALDYYLDDYEIGEQKSKGIFITKKNEKCDGVVLVKEKRVKICLK